MNKINNLWDLMDNSAYKLVFVNAIYTEILKNLKDAFGYCCRNELSINDYCPPERFGNQKNQITVFVSVRMSELWENAIYEGIKELFGEIEIRIGNVKRWTDADGDIKIFDEQWEIKTSQANNSWTGATHSSHKVSKYILINYRINKDIKLSPTTSLIKEFIPQMSVFLLDLSKAENISNPWVGVPTYKSSFSTLKINNEWVKKGCVKEIFGKIKITKSKNAKIILQDTKDLTTKLLMDQILTNNVKIEK